MGKKKPAKKASKPKPPAEPPAAEPPALEPSAKPAALGSVELSNADPANGQPTNAESAVDEAAKSEPAENKMAENGPSTAHSVDSNPAEHSTSSAPIEPVEPGSDKPTGPEPVIVDGSVNKVDSGAESALEPADSDAVEPGDLSIAVNPEPSVNSADSEASVPEASGPEASTAAESAKAGSPASKSGGSESDASSGPETSRKTVSGPASTAELEDLRSQLEAAEAERDEIQEEYDSLLEKVGTIKLRLGERFKELEKAAEQARQEARTYKAECETLRGSHKDADIQVSTLNAEIYAARAETEAAKAEAEAAKADAQAAKAEAKSANAEISAATADAIESRREADIMKKQLVSQKIMFDQELANEKSTRESLELQLEQLRTKLDSEKSTADQLHRVNSHQEQQIEKLKQDLVQAKSQLGTQQSQSTEEVRKIRLERDALKGELEQERQAVVSLTKTSAQAVEKQQSLEKDARDSQLLIGKLRHEAVILNEHLTHALRVVRKDSEGSTVDKELVSNLFIQFATCPRQDTKKFEILMLIANFLGWDEERRKVVGLEKNEEMLESVPQQTQMVGMVGKLAEFLENRRSK